MLLNHETPYACDTESYSSISEIILDRSKFMEAIGTMVETGGRSTGGTKFVKHVGLAYDAFRTKSGRRVDSFGDNDFVYFCSGHLHPPEEFGPGRGFVDGVYIFGEEEEADNG